MATTVEGVSHIDFVVWQITLYGVVEDRVELSSGLDKVCTPKNKPAEILLHIEA